MTVILAYIDLFIRGKMSGGNCPGELSEYLENDVSFIIIIIIIVVVVNSIINNIIINNILYASPATHSSSSLQSVVLRF